ncbi:MAG TPA: helix-turn-helix domain-containing protein [Solirubrobacteraceae bacterium]
MSKVRCEIDERLDELRPLLAEHDRLLDAAAALETTGSTSTADAPERLPAPEATDEDSVTRRTVKAGATVKPSRLTPSASRSARRPRPAPAARSAAGETILAALEHGSHTVSELAVVTAMSGPSINGNLRKLISEGAVVKTEREGKAAWALAAAA